jgi:hypothetical protein
MTSQLYVSQISHVEGNQASSCVQRVVEAIPEHIMRRGRRIPERYSGGRGRTLVWWSRKQSPSTGRVVEEAVPDTGRVVEDEHWSGGRGGSPLA